MPSAYDHLRDDTGVETALTGRPPKKGTVTIEFIGTVADFQAWLEATFKDYKDMPIQVRSWSEEAPVPERLKTPTPYRTVLDSLATLTGLPIEQIDSEFGPVMDFIRTGQKIEAIKRVRTFTGLGLKEAKDWVEAVGAVRSTIVTAR